MSLKEQAEEELRRIDFGGEDTKVMLDILDKFFDQWDSGGAVHYAAPILARLIAGKCLSPLTGAPDEWVDHGDGVFQNRRVSSVFKDRRFHDGLQAYDLDNPAGPREAITFPYWPERTNVPSPVVEL